MDWCEYDMFKNFAWYTSEGDWSVVWGNGSVVLFMDRDYICAFNQSEGGVPEFIDFWNMIVSMGAIVDAISFRILAGMLYGPWALFGFNSDSELPIICVTGRRSKATHNFFMALELIVANYFFTAGCDFRVIFFPAASSMTLYGLPYMGKVLYYRLHINCHLRYFCLWVVWHVSV